MSTVIIKVQQELIEGLLWKIADGWSTYHGIHGVSEESRNQAISILAAQAQRCAVQAPIARQMPRTSGPRPEHPDSYSARTPVRRQIATEPKDRDTLAQNPRKFASTKKASPEYECSGPKQIPGVGWWTVFIG